MSNSPIIKFITQKQKETKSKIFDIFKIKNKKIWTKEEDEFLIFYATVNKEKHWKEISSHFKGKNWLQCFSRYYRIKPGIIKGKWTEEEDKIILKMVQQYGKSWPKIAKIFKTRNGKQIRNRYINVLDPSIKKEKFSKEEDDLLIELYKKYGAQWSKITKFLPMRTTDMIKNHFHSSIKKKFYCLSMVKRHKENLLRSKRERDNLDLQLKPTMKEICNKRNETEDELSFNDTIHKEDSISKIHSYNETELCKLDFILALEGIYKDKYNGVGENEKEEMISPF